MEAIISKTVRSNGQKLHSTPSLKYGDEFWRENLYEQIIVRIFGKSVKLMEKYKLETYI